MVKCPKCGHEATRTLGNHLRYSKCAVTMEELFWAKVDKAGAGGCWNWTASRKERGYGQFLHKRKMHRAHRLAWTLTGHELPKPPLELLHSCHNRVCVNPAHLRVGTHAENMAESKAAKRHVFGERHQWAKLKESQVIEIRQRFKRDGRRSNAKELAAEYGVSKQHISEIARGIRWATMK